MLRPQSLSHVRSKGKTYQDYCTLERDAVSIGRLLGNNVSTRYFSESLIQSFYQMSDQLKTIILGYYYVCKSTLPELNSCLKLLIYFSLVYSASLLFIRVVLCSI
jgi:hypothetical protein